MTLFIICIVLAVVCFTIVALMNNGERNYTYEKNEMVNKFINEKEITINKRFSGYNFDLIHDMENECVWYFVRVNDELQHKQINYKDIFQVEYKQDDQTITSTSRSSQLGGALVGGALAGGVGAVIGGLSGKQKQSSQVKQIMLTLLIDDLEIPSLDIEFAFFHPPKDLSQVDDSVARDWYNLFRVIITKVERELENSK